MGEKDQAIKPVQSKWKRPEPKVQETFVTNTSSAPSKPVQSKWKRPEPKVQEKSNATNNKPAQTKWKRPEPTKQELGECTTDTKKNTLKPVKSIEKLEKTKEEPKKQVERKTYPKFVAKTDEQEKEEMKQFQMELEEEE